MKKLAERVAEVLFMTSLFGLGWFVLVATGSTPPTTVNNFGHNRHNWTRTQLKIPTKILLQTLNP